MSWIWGKHIHFDNTQYQPESFIQVNKNDDVCSNFIFAHSELPLCKVSEQVTSFQ